MSYECEHLESAAERREGVLPSSKGCRECLESGSSWVHLRLCLTCGHVGCCDSSIHQHASKHYHATEHPVVRSYEPGEDWGYCYVDHAYAAELPARREEVARVHYHPL